MSTIQALNDLAARVLGPGPAGGIRFHLRSGNVHEDGDWFSLEDGDPGRWSSPATREYRWLPA